MNEYRYLVDIRFTAIDDTAAKSHAALLAIGLKQRLGVLTSAYIAGASIKKIDGGAVFGKTIFTEGVIS